MRRQQSLMRRKSIIVSLSVIAEIALVLSDIAFFKSAQAATYYLMNGGAGAKDGTSLANAFGADEMSAFSVATGFSPGDTIKVYDDGGSIYGAYSYNSKTYTLILAGNGTPGSPITIEPGDGEQPLFTGLVDYSTGWVDEGGNIWYHALPNNDEVGFVMFGAQDQSSIGVWSNLKTDLDTNKDYWTDVTNSRIYVYADADPATKWVHVYVPVQDAGLYSYETLPNDYWIVRNLHIEGYNALAVRFGSTVGTRITGNDISWIGGRRSTGTSRLGNGIQVDKASSYVHINVNDVDQVFDACIGPHQYSDDTMEYLYVYDNLMDRCGSGSGTEAITSTNPIVQHAWFYRNRITNMGYGWSGTANSKHGQGLSFGGNVDGALLTDIYAFDNYIDTFAAYGMTWSQTNGKGYFSRNEITGGTADYTTTTPAAVMVHGGSDGNTVRDVTLDAYYNYIHDNIPHGVYAINNQSEVNWWNNTLVNNGSGTTYYSLYSTANTGDTYTNNLVKNASSRCVFDVSTSQSTYDYNLYYREDGGVIGRYAAVDRATVAAWQTATGQDAHALDDDPLIDSQGRPALNSPVINAGTDVGFPYWGGAPEIGAYEVGSTSGKIGNIPYILPIWSMMGE